MLYLRDLNPDVEAPAIRQMIDEQISGEDLQHFAWRLFVGVMEFRGPIDVRIRETAENWSLERMAPTDRNVLRLGAYELLHTDTPHRVVLDEAIELARTFGTANSGPFVNGILDRLVSPERRASPARIPRPSPSDAPDDSAAEPADPAHDEV